MIKYFWKLFPSIFVIILLAPLSDGFQFKYYLKATICAVIMLLVITMLLAIIDVKIFKKYYLRLNDRVATLFNSTVQSENLNMVRIGKYDVYILINSEGNYPIEFHIPRKQIDKMKHKPDFKMEEYSIERIETYKIGQSSNLFLKRNKRIIEKKIAAVAGYK